MEFNLDSLKTLFKDENGKPKTRNIIIATVIGAVIILILKNITSPPSGTEESSSSLGVNYNLPKEEEKGSVRIGTNADIHYITKGEMEFTLSRQLEEFTKMQAETMAIVLQETQNNILQIIKEENKAQQYYLQSSFEDKLSILEKELYEVKQNQRDYEEIILDMPYSFTPSPPTSAAGQSPATVDQPRTRPSIPTNDYTGAGYQSNFSFEQSYQTEDYIRNDSGYIVNNYQTTKPDYIVNSGQIYDRGFTRTDGIISGTLYSGLLVTGAVSSKESCPVIVKLAEDIIVKNKVLIPKETRLIGVAVADYNTRQIYFNINRLVLNDREIAIKASLVNKDGTPGFCSKYIDKTNEAFWKNFALNFASTLMQSFKDVTYFVSDQGLPVKIYDDTSLNRAIDASSSGLLSFADRILRDAQAMGAIILVDPNIEVKIMIEENISLEKLRG